MITTTIKSVVYPEKIAESLLHVRHAGTGADREVVGVAANFSCGSFIRFLLSADAETGSIRDANFVSNGCGFMLAAADVLADSVIGCHLSDLHGLLPADLKGRVQKTLCEFPAERLDCISAAIEALKAAFAELRVRQIEEFQGERALICTCFGVAEDVIESQIANGSLTLVDEVTRCCNAGGGCGSCRMLIQEMIDAAGTFI